jgi:hypothetical protein
VQHIYLFTIYQWKHIYLRYQNIAESISVCSKSDIVNLKSDGCEIVINYICKRNPVLDCY